MSGPSLPLRPAKMSIAEAPHYEEQLESEPTQNGMRTTAPSNSEEYTELDAAEKRLAEAELDASEEPAIDAPPFTPLEYTISEEAFREARATPHGRAGSFWSHTLYRGPEDPEQSEEAERKVKVHYCRNARTAEDALQYLLGEECLGLDLEWSPHARKGSGPRKNVSLVQLASPSRVLLLHIALYPKSDQFMTPTLRKILEDPAVTKTGVWIKGDCARLETFLGVQVRGMFELSHLFNQVTHLANGTPELINKKLVALAKQVQHTTGLPLYKDNRVRASDWSRVLSLQQVEYSASDAYAGVQLYAMLNHKRQKLDPVPDLPFHAELDRPIPLPPGLEIPVLAEPNTGDNTAVEALVEANGNLENNVLVDDETVRIEVEDNAQFAVVNDTAAESEVDASAVPGFKQKAKTRTKDTPSATRGPIDPMDPRIIAAKTWHSELQSMQTDVKPKTQFAKMRAYFLWHNYEDLNPEAISRMLQIQSRTVATYILDAVIQEKLPYDRFRMKLEIVNRLDARILQWRYTSVWRDTKLIFVP